MIFPWIVFPSSILICFSYFSFSFIYSFYEEITVSLNGSPPVSHTRAWECMLMNGRRRTFLFVMMVYLEKNIPLKHLEKLIVKQEYQLFFSWLLMKKSIVPQWHITLNIYIYIYIYICVCVCVCVFVCMFVYMCVGFEMKSLSN